MRRFARWHIWLGWAAAIPLLVWVISGLFMAARPIEDVRGEALLTPPLMLDENMSAKFPTFIGKFPPTESIKLVQQVSGPVWIVILQDKRRLRASGLEGRWIGPVDAIEARALAEAAYAGKAKLSAIRRFAAEAAPLDLRKSRPSWQASFADGTHVYIDADTGEVLALRTRFWRAYDFMWGLHIMDPRTREDTSNWFLWVFGGVALVSCAIGSILLFRRRKARR